MFKRSPTLTEQIKSHIKEQIVNNEFEDGRIPSETELANVLGVSRTTIRDALSRLEIEGAVVRKQGAGTFVNEPILQIRSRLEEIWSYESVLEAHGYVPTVRVVGLREVPTDPHISANLDLSPDDTLMEIEKLFLENDTPVIFTSNRIPTKLIVHPFQEEDCRQPIYQLLETNCEQELSYYLSDIVPVVATEYVAEKLQVRPQTALLTLEEVGYNKNNEPILTATSYIRDDLLRFRIIRRRS